MNTLTVIQNGKKTALAFTGEAPLSTLLAEGGFAVEHPCGGRGRCRKCAVELAGAVSPPDEEERRAGARLSCRARILGDAVVTLPDTADARIELSGAAAALGRPMAGRLGAAVDVGTTTLALRLYDLAAGRLLGGSAAMNPQTRVAADVMGRIGASMNGRAAELRSDVLAALDRLLTEACREAAVDPAAVDALTVAGNTTMLYLLTGRDPAPLSHAPFAADDLFGRTETVLGRTAWLPPCMHAFVGADITCAVLASAMTAGDRPALLADIGTNGELALWKDGTLYVSSTAAGPAFEGAGISCGCGSVTGAVDAVWLEDGEVRVHTIGGAAPRGVCGSGLIDGAAALLASEAIDETGAACGSLTLCPGVALTQEDIRAVQLAKSAIAAGIEVLLETAGVAADALDALYIAGGFGSHLDIRSAAAIGLIPEALTDRVKPIGNAALSGAAMLLLDKDKMAGAERLASIARHVDLGGNKTFNEKYVDHMFFETF